MMLGMERTMVGTNPTVFPAIFCCRENFLMSSLLVNTEMVNDMFAGDRGI
jgi:hypothetical protein